MTATSSPIVVQLDAYGDTLFHGITFHDTWNGFACPLFPLDEALRLAVINNAMSGAGTLVFCPDQDAFTYVAAEQDAEDEATTFEATSINGIAYYPIGAFVWCWSDCNDEAALFSASLVHEMSEMRKLGMRVPDKALNMATSPSIVQKYLNKRAAEVVGLIIDHADASSPSGDSPLSIYHHFAVCAVVALDEAGEAIPVEQITSVPAAAHMTTHPGDANVSSWGIYGELFDNSVDHLADCPTQQIADAVAAALNTHYGRRPA